MNKFKVGDKVKAIKNISNHTPYYEIGNVYYVTDIDIDDSSPYQLNKMYWCSEDELELLERLEKAQKILTEEEKEYLSNVIKTFRDRVKYISKVGFTGIGVPIIAILIDNKIVFLPYFEENKMYTGMQLYKEYTLKELGL